MLSVADIGLKFCLSIVTATTSTAACCRVDRDHHSSLVCEPTLATTLARREKRACERASERDRKCYRSFDLAMGERLRCYNDERKRERGDKRFE